MGKYKVPLEKRKEKEKKDINEGFNILITYLVCMFISIFVGVGAFTLFFAEGIGVGSSLILSSTMTGLISSFITIVAYKQTNK